MKRALKRIATVAATLPLAVGSLAGSANASHAVTVPGCYGGGTNQTVICNLTVTVGVPAGAETYQTTVPLCVGTCQNVPVTLVRQTPGEPVSVCYTYNTLGSAPTTTCYSGATVDPWIQYVVRAVENALNTVDTLYYRYCNSVANAVDDVIVIYC